MELFSVGPVYLVVFFLLGGGPVKWDTLYIAIFDELSNFSVLGGTSSILRTFLGRTSQKKHPVYHDDDDDDYEDDDEDDDDDENADDDGFDDDDDNGDENKSQCLFYQKSKCDNADILLIFK